ncbi:lipopolysaccharide biosynthesis protein [Rhodococcus sp. 14-2470-1b]|uniref:lipopolysaccharide biosynthesis protein n=1 Tax=Rhodococcus sp. 14-2470-1b TaxID=2023149 RepID=UPI00159506B5|nr:oligosaccharide flippase family protein [Rhodococcus sp. 14-2470-1b]
MAQATSRCISMVKMWTRKPSRDCDQTVSLGKTRITNSPLLISVSRIAIMLISLGTAPIISRELGVDGRGVYATCLAAISLAPVVMGLGIPMAIRRMASVGALEPVIRVSYLIAMLLVGPAFAFGVLVSVLLLPGLTQGDRSVFCIAMGTSALFIIVLSVQSGMISRGEFTKIAILQFIQPGVTAALVIGCWIFSDVTVTFLLISYIIGTAAASIIAVTQICVPVFGPRASMLFVGRRGLRYAGSQIAETASNTVVLLFAAVVIGTTETGFLSVAMTLAAIPLAGGYAIGSAVFKSVASSPPDRLIHVRRLAIRTAIYLGVLVGMVLAFFAPSGIPLLFGAEFDGSVHPALILIAGSPVLVGNYVSTQVLGAEGRGVTMSICQIGGVLVSLVGLFAVSTHLGAVGAAIGILLGWVVTFFSSLAALRIGPSVLRINSADVKASINLCLRGGV